MLAIINNICNDSDYDCTLGYICLGNATSATPDDGITGYKCPAGQYCPDPAGSPINCPETTFNSLEIQFEVGACLTCIEGYYCEGEPKYNHKSQVLEQFHRGRSPAVTRAD